jgi:uroporphyrinogen decarboxylase
MDRLTEATIRYLRAQVTAGAHVIQLFDSWVGALAPADFDQFVLPWTRRVFAGIRDLNAPTIYFGTGNAALLESMSTAGSDLVSVDWRVSLGDAWARIGYDKGIQGNLDPVLLLAPWERVEEGMHDVLRRAAGRPGHVFNLGHGVLPDTEPEQLARLVQAVHEATAVRAAEPAQEAAAR